MAVGIVLIFCGLFFMLIPANPTKIIAFALIAYGIYRIITSSKRTNPRARKKDYTAEARRACEAVTPKKDKNSTPPWEE